MLTELGKSAAQKLIDKAISIGVPALVFWSLGVLMWVLAERRAGVLVVGQTWLAEAPVLTQGLALLWGTTVVGASAVLVDRLTHPVLRLLEGYWPEWAEPGRKRLVDKYQTKHDEEGEEYNKLEVRRINGEPWTPKEQAQWIRLEKSMHERPSKKRHIMPTRTGNLLKSAETRPQDKYGLDAIVVWPRLWLVMPESSQQAVATARASLNVAVAAVIWGSLFAVLVPVGLVAVGAPAGWDWSFSLAAFGSALLGVILAFAAISWWVPSRAKMYGKLVESVFDLHRAALYEALRWPLPATPSEELLEGPKLTQYLWQGSDEDWPRFTEIPPPQTRPAQAQDAS